VALLAAHNQRVVSNAYDDGSPRTANELAPISCLTKSPRGEWAAYIRAPQGDDGGFNGSRINCRRAGCSLPEADAQVYSERGNGLCEHPNIVFFFHMIDGGVWQAPSTIW